VALLFLHNPFSGRRTIKRNADSPAAGNWPQIAQKGLALQGVTSNRRNFGPNPSTRERYPGINDGNAAVHIRACHCTSAYLSLRTNFYIEQRSSMTTLKQGGSIRNRLMEYASRLRFPKLVLLTAILFGIDLLVPDVIPFADEILLGLITMILSSFKNQRISPKP
jgi:hypothetical protein